MKGIESDGPYICIRSHTYWLGNPKAKIMDGIVEYQSKQNQTKLHYTAIKQLDQPRVK